MEVGRELDALVAEKVMRVPKLCSGHLELDPDGVYPGESQRCTVCCAEFELEGYGHEPHALVPRRYSTEIAASWDVLLKCMSTLGGDARQNFRYELCLRDADILSEEAPALICFSALKAMGVEVPA